jgi:hypothetical protein
MSASNPSNLSRWPRSADWTILVTCVIAAMMSVIALGHRPYAYYTCLRWVVCLSSVWSAGRFYLLSRRRPFPFVLANILAPSLAIVAVVFNPLAPLSLSRGAWQAIDAGAAAWLLIMAIVTFVLYVPGPVKRAREPSWLTMLLVAGLLASVIAGVVAYSDGNETGRRRTLRIRLGGGVSWNCPPGPSC